MPDTTPNPHLWYDPKTMPAVAQALASDLAALEPAHAATFQANATRFVASLQPWLDAIAAFKAKYAGTHGGDHRAGRRLPAHRHGHRQPDPVAVPGRHHERHRPHAQDITLENGLLHQTPGQGVLLQPAGHRRPDRARSATPPCKAGVPVVGVYETMPTPGYDYQSWMLAEVKAIQKAIADGISTEHL